MSARIDNGVVTVYASMYKISSAVAAWSQITLGTLPERFRPAAGELGGCAYAESTKNTGIAPVGIGTNGAVRVLTRNLSLAANWMCSFSVSYGAQR